MPAGILSGPIGLTSVVTSTVTVPRFGTAAAIGALALGGFTIGTTEFVTMGLFPQLASQIERSIATTGHLVAAYAFGVVTGAPVIVAGCARWPKRRLAVILVLLMALGNALTAASGAYLPILLARFIAGLPHGAFFGVASLLAASMVPPHRQGRAISGVMMGLSVATVVGVPAATAVGQRIGWQAAYLAVVVMALLAAAMIHLAVPAFPGDPEATVARELTALKRPAVLVTALTGVIGFGGMFAMYSYIAPITTDVTDRPESWIPWFLFAFGIGSVIGTWLAGILADRNNIAQIAGGLAATVIVLVAFYWTAGWTVPTFLGVFAIGVLGSVLAIGLQIRLMTAAGNARMLGAALNHSALNLANGIGAMLGGAVIAIGWGTAAPALVGAVLAATGLLIFWAGLRWAPVTASEAARRN